MSNNLEKEVDNFLECLRNEDKIKEYLIYKDMVLKDRELLKKIEYFHTLVDNTEEYKKVKHELFQNDVYRKYLNLENEIFFLILSINSKLKSLVKKEGCIK